MRTSKSRATSLSRPKPLHICLLPEEHLIQIFSYIPLGERKDNVARVCKQFSQVVRLTIKNYAIDLRLGTRSLRNESTACLKLFPYLENICLFDLPVVFTNPDDIQPLLRFNPTLWQDYRLFDGFLAPPSVKKLQAVFTSLLVKAVKPMKNGNIGLSNISLTLALPQMNISASELQKNIESYGNGAGFKDIRVLYGSIDFDGGLNRTIQCAISRIKQTDKIRTQLEQTGTVYCHLSSLAIQLTQPSTARQFLQILSTDAFPALEVLGLHFKPTVRAGARDQPMLEELNISRLKELYLCNAPLNSGFNAFTHLKALEKLCIQYEEDLMDVAADDDMKPSLNNDASLRQLCRLPNLQILELESLADDVGLNTLTNLHKLTISPEEDSTLTEFHELANLKVLKIVLSVESSDANDLFDNLYLPDNNGLTSLETLEIRGLLWRGGSKASGGGWVDDADSDEESDNYSDDDGDISTVGSIDTDTSDDESSSDYEGSDGNFDEIEHQVDNNLVAPPKALDVESEVAASNAPCCWKDGFARVEERYISTLLKKIPSLKCIILSDFCSNFNSEMAAEVGKNKAYKSDVLKDWTVAINEIYIIGGISEYEITWSTN